MTFFGGLAPFFLTITLTLQQGFGLGPLATGLTFVAFGVGFVTGSRLSAGVARWVGPRVINLGTAMMVTGLATIVLLARAAHGMALDGRWLTAVLVWYGLGQGLVVPSLVAVVVGSSRIPAADAGSVSGVFSTVQQLAFALGVAAIGGVFFGVLGAGGSPADYDAALSAALLCNMGLLSATFVMALWLPRAENRGGPE